MSQKTKVIQLEIEISEDSPSFDVDLKELVKGVLFDKKGELANLGLELKSKNDYFEISGIGKKDFIRIRLGLSQIKVSYTN